jgi:hypothetical protein
MSHVTTVSQGVRLRPAIAIFILLIATALVLRVYTLTTAGLDWDESLYIVIAQRWLAGGIPYLTVWDQHPMGLPALFAVAELFFRDGLVAARVACFIAVVGTAFLLGLFMLRHVGSMVSAVVAGMLYLLCMTRPEGLAANTECFNNLLVTASAFLLFNETTRATGVMRTGVVFAASLLLGIGLQIKYVVLPEAAFLCCAMLLHQWKNGAGTGRVIGVALLAMVGGILPTAIASFYFWYEGAWAAYMNGNISVNVRYVDEFLPLDLTLLRLRLGLLPLIGMLPWPFVLAWLSRDPEMRRRYGWLMLWLLVWLVAAALDVAMPLKLWKHYFNALIPPLCLAAALSIEVMLLRGKAMTRAAVVLGIMTVLPAVGSIVKHIPDSRSIDRVNVPSALGQQILDGGTNGHDVYVFNYDPLVYAYANAVPPTKYVLGIELADFAKTSGIDSQAEIHRILTDSPRWIVVADPSMYKLPLEIWDDLNSTLRNYHVVADLPEEDYIQPPYRVMLYERNN